MQESIVSTSFRCPQRCDVVYAMTSAALLTQTSLVAAARDSRVRQIKQMRAYFRYRCALVVAKLRQTGVGEKPPRNISCAVRAHARARRCMMLSNMISSLQSAS